MNFAKLHSAISEEFSPKIALMVVQIVTINMTTKFPEDISRFAEKVEKKARKLLWEESRADIELALELCTVCHDWEIRQSMNGLGGCERKSFKELLGIC